MIHSYLLIDEFSHADQEPFTPKIVENPKESPSVAFNTVSIPIDGRADALLNWKEPRLEALKAISDGKKLFWEIDLGLFSRLSLPLLDQTQFLTLGLSLDHFRDSLWAEFKQHTIGICLYRGGLDFHRQIWREELKGHFSEWLKDRHYQYEQIVKEPIGQRLLQLFCRDVATEYLELLARRLPDGLMGAVLLETESIDHELLLAQLLVKERFERMARFVSNGRLAADLFSVSQKELGGFNCKISHAPSSKRVNYGICLPEASHAFFEYEEPLELFLKELKRDSIGFRFVSETTLTSEWDGLDYLVVIAPLVSVQGIRKLRGFCAAGGTVIPVGGSLEL